jgi:hypothetical protein
MATQSMKLYEIADEIQDVCNAVLEAEGEMTPELEARWEAASLAFADKLDATLGWMRTMELMAAGLREDEKRLAALRKSREKAVERMEGYVLEQLRRVDRKRVDTARHSASRVLCPPSVRPTTVPKGTLILAERAAEKKARDVMTSTLDARWWTRVKVSIEFDAVAAAAWLKGEGVELEEPGEVVVENVKLSRRERLARR